MRVVAESIPNVTGIPPIDLIMRSSPAELVEWHRHDREARGVTIEGRTCRTCGGEGIVDGDWCPTCDGNLVEWRGASCPVCKDDRVVLRDNEAAVCPACHGGADYLANLLDRADVPAHYQTYTWNTLDALDRPTPSQQKARQLLKQMESSPHDFSGNHRRYGACLVGTPGTRKTGTCVPAFRGLAERTYANALFVSWRSWLDDVAATWKPNSVVTTAQLLERIATTDLVMLDDFGGASADARPWVADIAFKVLESRIQVCAPTLVTTNQTLAGIGQAYGDAVLSRLTELCVLVEVKGLDERKRAAA